MKRIRLSRRNWSNSHQSFSRISNNWTRRSCRATRLCENLKSMFWTCGRNFNN